MYDFLWPALPLVLERFCRRQLDEKRAEEVKKALLSGAIFLSVALGLNLYVTLVYSAMAVLSSFRGRAVYTSLFGGLLAFTSYLVASPLVSLVPLGLMSIASPIAYLLNRAMWRGEKGFFWLVYMYSLSSAVTAGLLVAFECINPLWGLLIAGVAAWSGKVDDSFAMPLFTFISVAYIYAPLSGLVAGFGFSLVASSAAYYLKALDLNGLVAGVTVGSLIYAASPMLFVVLLSFLVSSSLFGRFAKHDERYQTKGKRNAIQVMSNAFGVCLAGLFILSGRDFLGAGIAAIAAAAADTWATELGSLSKRKPRLITTFKTVEKGKSGGVTPLGLGASLLAGVFIFLVTYPFHGTTYLIHAVVGGAVGSLVDSLLGATIQGIYLCRICGRATEREVHCGKSSVLDRGIWWFNNDLVNLVSTVVAMVVLL